MERDLLTRAFPVGLIAAAAVAMTGCEIDSFFDPSKTGYFQHQPTMIPILDRIDVIEPDEPFWGETTGVMPEDLLPNDLTYVLAPGDYITVEVFDIRTAEQWGIYPRRIDAAGNFRIAEIGDIRAAGRTVQEFEDHVAELMLRLVTTPRVYVHVEDPAAFTYTIEGHLFNPGLYVLRKSDLRLNEALAAVGGVPRNTERVIVIRRVRLTEELLPPYERPDVDRPPAVPPRERPQVPVDIEDLIEQLEDDTRPGMLGTFDRPATGRSPIDIDTLEPVRVSVRPVDVNEVRRQVAPSPIPEPPADETFIYIEELGEWVRARQDAPAQPDPAAENRARPRQEFPAVPPATRRVIDPRDLGPDEPGPRLVAERHIEIPYELLLVDSSYDIVVRPGDRIHVEGPRSGLVYISGEIMRPGVFDLPLTRERLTLSRFIAAAGDLGPIAQPERVDITRMIGRDREATIRVNLAAIRRRTEPDIFIKPGDHIHIGTSWIATPLAVIRNGFRVTYGFGFLLDRNFGNDVFGAPPFRGTTQ